LDPLGEVTSTPQNSQLDFRGDGRDKGRGKDRRERDS